ncbi:(deoxy)nucleoside triphosphate pyrophosphohydrolase [Tellurirhabdus rosea]|uniref:(deoxy)nucleoside triphosphate pyrophosphohydrolase n=1 Tax=Tellurirhabdus rosea TaxID=2674997 RepID=UPI002254F15C|nr:(deoxy)nucleoside triphosphate pyrophosphohydrolase [Tellurirhabdus rosea]
MNIILVVCGIIFNKEGKLLATQRSEQMPLPLKWEFPGGKVIEGEEPSAAIERELNEELSVSVRVVRELPTFDHQEETRVIRLLPFVCLLSDSATVVLTEHAQDRWIGNGELEHLDWAKADIPVTQYLKTHWQNLLAALPADQENAQ